MPVHPLVPGYDKRRPGPRPHPPTLHQGQVQRQGRAVGYRIRHTDQRALPEGDPPVQRHTGSKHGPGAQAEHDFEGLPFDRRFGLLLKQIVSRKGRSEPGAVQVHPAGPQRPQSVEDRDPSAAQAGAHHQPASAEQGALLSDASGNAAPLDGQEVDPFGFYRYGLSADHGARPDVQRNRPGL